jgi:hypothetical protein
MAVGLSALRVDCPLPPPPQEDSCYSFLLDAEFDPRARVRLEGFGKLKKSNNLIGNGTRDLLACSIVPQPTTLSRAPNLTYIFSYYMK